MTLLMRDQENIEKGKIEGRAEGIIETGVDFGLSDKEILEKLQIKLNIFGLEKEAWREAMVKKHAQK